MNKIKRLRWSYVYRTLDIDTPWFCKTDIKVLFLFEGRIWQRQLFSISNCGFGIWVNCDAVLKYSRATMCSIAVFPPPPPLLRPPPTGTDKKKRASNFGFKRSRRYFISKQEEAWRRLRGMYWCKKELPVCWMAMESWVVYHQQMYAEETEMSCYGLRHYRRWVAYKASIATRNKSYINITTIYAKSVRWFT